MRSLSATEEYVHRHKHLPGLPSAGQISVFAMRKPMAEYLLLPAVNIYHYILYQNQAGFEQAVYEALVKWKQYYTLKYTDEHSEDHSTQPQGYLALPIAAACAYAYDKVKFAEFELLVKGDD